MSDLPEKHPWQRKSREEIFSSDYVSLYKDCVRLADGETIPDYYIVNYGLGAVGIVLEDNDKNILLVRHYRYSVDKVLWEIPAGRIDANEEPLIAARRELLEETGYDCFNLEKTGISHPAIGNSDLTFYFFKGSEFKKITNIVDNEIIEVKWFSKDDVHSLIKSGEILSGLCQSCLFHAFL